MDTISVLKNVTLFSNLSDKNLKRVAKLCRDRAFEADQTIVHQDDDGIGLFVITEGEVKIVKTTDEGQKLEIATHRAGEFFGEFSVLDGAPRTAHVIATKPTKCVVLAGWDFRTLMEGHPRIALQILPIIVKRFRETNEQLLTLSTKR